MPNYDSCNWPVHFFAMAFARRLYWHAQDGSCGICRARMKRNFGSPKLTFDHVWPKAWSTSVRPEAKFQGNILLTHERCNMAKDDAPPSPDQVAFLHDVNRKLGFMPHETSLWDAPHVQRASDREG